MRSHCQNIVDSSQWPIVVGILLNILVISLVYMFRCSGPLNWFVVLVGYFWGRDIVREGSYVGNHLSIVSASVLNSIQLFIFSEVCFFGGFFWSYYYNLFDLDADVSMSFLFDVMDNCGLPLLNTGLLLISGIAVTWSHHGMHLGIEFGRGVVYSLLLGVAFLFCQYYEYVSTGFSISDGLYGSVFFALTGFHSFHVAIGCSLLLLNVLRSDMQYGNSISLECSIWYWHFVDVVWIGLYLIVYCALSVC